MARCKLTSAVRSDSSAAVCCFRRWRSSLFRAFSSATSGLSVKRSVVMAGLLLPDHHAPNTIEIDLVRIFGVFVDHVAVTQHSAPAYVEAALVVVVLGRNSGGDFPSPWKVHAHISPPCLRWAARAAEHVSCR